MHACGHDVHMTVLVGTARQLVRVRDQWRGTLIMIGQPAEERGAGAKAMLDAGLFTLFPRPDYNLALHVHAGLPAGEVGYVVGPALANVDSVDITVYGVGGHGAIPQLPDHLQSYQPIVEMLLAKEPNDRFSSADEFVEGLMSIDRATSTII